MNAIRRKARSGVVALCIGASVSTLVASCYDDDDYYDDYYDPYGYAYGYYPYSYNYYYPADLAYADMYYSDYSYYGYPVGYAEPLTLKGTSSPSSPGAVLRALAAGEVVCPDQVTVETTPAPAPCQLDAVYPLALGKTIELQGCQLPGGGSISGSIQIAATLNLSDPACGDGTVVDVSYTSTTTNLAFTSAAGARIVVPSLTRSASYTRVLGELPATLELQAEGRIEHFDASGAMLSANTLTGNQTLGFLGADTGYTLDGTMMLADVVNGQTVTLTGTGVTRSTACCYPTSGTIALDRSDGDDQSFAFGPGCVEPSVNGAPAGLGECY
jgi:hypothetical protein